MGEQRTDGQLIDLLNAVMVRMTTEKAFEMGFADELAVEQARSKADGLLKRVDERLHHEAAQPPSVGDFCGILFDYGDDQSLANQISDVLSEHCRVVRGNRPDVIQKMIAIVKLPTPPASSSDEGSELE
jgi:hypothetical protein